jgi:hypothetical protein
VDLGDVYPSIEFNFLRQSALSFRASVIGAPRFVVLSLRKGVI